MDECICFFKWFVSREIVCLSWEFLSPLSLIPASYVTQSWIGWHLLWTLPLESFSEQRPILSLSINYDCQFIHTAAHVVFLLLFFIIAAFLLPCVFPYVLPFQHISIFISEIVFPLFFYLTQSLISFFFFLHITLSNTTWSSLIARLPLFAAPSSPVSPLYQYFQLSSSSYRHIMPRSTAY